MVPGNNPGLIILPGEVAVAAELVIQQPFVKFLADCRMIPFHLWQSSNLSKNNLPYIFKVSSVPGDALSLRWRL